MIALTKGPSGRFVAHRQIVPEGHGIFVRRIHPKASFGANDFIGGGIHGAKTARKRAEPVIRKTQQGAAHLINFTKASLAVTAAIGEGFLRFSLEEIACGIDAVDSKIVQRASAEIVPCADVSLFDLQREKRIKKARLAYFPRLDYVRWPADLPLQNGGGTRS